MKPVKSALVLLICLGLLMPFKAMAIKLKYKDNRGRYHYNCTDKTGGVTIVTYRAEGIYVDGPRGQKFFPMNTADAIRSPEFVKITERHARWGCREKLVR